MRLRLAVLLVLVATPLAAQRPSTFTLEQVASYPFPNELTAATAAAASPGR